ARSSRRRPAGGARRARCGRRGGRWWRAAPVRWGGQGRWWSSGGLLGVGARRGARLGAGAHRGTRLGEGEEDLVQRGLAERDLGGGEAPLGEGADAAGQGVLAGGGQGDAAAV